MAVSIQLIVDNGVGALTRTTGPNFDAAQYTRLQTAVDHALLAQGIASPTNAQRVDYLWGLLKADMTNFVRADEQATATAAVTNIAT